MDEEFDPAIQAGAMNERATGLIAQADVAGKPVDHPLRCTERAAGVAHDFFTVERDFAVVVSDDNEMPARVGAQPSE